MGEKYYRDTWVEIDLDAISHNVQAFRRHLPAQTKIMAVVKADGYGHGAVPVALEALRAGAEYLGVALLDEAIELRRAGIDAPVLILGYTSPQYLEEAISHGITLTVFHKDMIEAVEAAARRLQRKAKIHLKIDTGMGRIGVRTKEEFDELVVVAQRCPNVQVEGVFTHFSCADEEDAEYTNRQQHIFRKVIEPYQFPIVHCSNSAAGILFPEWGYNMIRLGISLYGQYPSAYVKGRGFRLKPAFSLKSKIVHVKEVPAGSAVSYGATWVSARETKVATVPVGYADGYPRLLSNRGVALVHGQKVPVIGRVCMDQLMLDVSAVPQCRIGDEAVLIGKQRGAEIEVDDVARLLQTINYEVTCMISKRVPRVYLKGGTVVLSKNLLL